MGQSVDGRSTPLRARWRWVAPMMSIARPIIAPCSRKAARPRGRWIGASAVSVLVSRSTCSQHPRPTHLLERGVKGNWRQPVALLLLRLYDEAPRCEVLHALIFTYLVPTLIRLYSPNSNIMAEREVDSRILCTRSVGRSISTLKPYYVRLRSELAATPIEGLQALSGRFHLRTLRTQAATRMHTSSTVPIATPAMMPAMVLSAWSTS